MSLDLDAYFSRIGWSGSAAADLPTLTGLLGAHMRAIPFENLDPLLGRTVRLDLDSLQDKLIRQKRGGYCFEQANLFAAVLEALGFKVTNHLARVVLRSPKAESPLTHMVNLVELPEGRFVADPGFGGPGANVPLPLVEGGAGHWFERRDGAWVLRGMPKDQPADLWICDFSTAYPVDFELPNHYVSTYPASIFTNNLMMNRFTPEGRVSLMNRDASIHAGGDVTNWQLSDRQELVTFLVKYFGIALPEAGSLRVPAIADWT